MPLFAFGDGSVRPCRSRRLWRFCSRRRPAPSIQASASIGTTIRHEALSRRRHRHFRIEGRDHRRGGRGGCPSLPAPQDAGAASGLGRTPPRGRLVGRFRPHHPRNAGDERHRSQVDPGRGGERHRALHAAGGCERRSADERRALRSGHKGAGRGRGTDHPHRRGQAGRTLRQCTDFAIGRAEDPLAQAQPSGDLRQDRQGHDLDFVHRAQADRRNGDRPLHGRELFAALHHRHAWLGHLAGERHHRAGTPADNPVFHARSPGMSRRKPRKPPAWPRARQSPAAPSTRRRKPSASA